MSYQCPHCEAEIEYLDVEQSGYQYGSYHIETQDSDWSDSDFEGDYYYKCPECDEEIRDPDDLEEYNEDGDDDEEEDEEELVEIKTPEMLNLFAKDDRNENYLMRDIVACKQCGQGYEFQHEEREAECSKCGNTLRK